MNILVIKPSSLGDIIHALPAIRNIKHCFPDSKISWIVFERFRRFLDAFADIDHVIPFNRREWGHFSNIDKLCRFLYRLSRERYDYVFDLQGLFRSGAFTFFARSANKVGFRHAREGAPIFYDLKVDHPDTLRHAVDKNIYLVNQALGISESFRQPALRIDADAAATANELREAHAITPEAITIAVAPTARWPSKAWPGFFFLTSSAV